MKDNIEVMRVRRLAWFSSHPFRPDRCWAVLINLLDEGATHELFEGHVCEVGGDMESCLVAQERLEHLLEVNVLTPNCVDETCLKVDAKVSGFAESLKDIFERLQFILIQTNEDCHIIHIHRRSPHVYCKRQQSK